MANKLRASGQIQDKDRYISISETKRQMVDMLTDIQSEIESYHLDIKSTEFDDGYNMGLGCSFSKIQERINALKEN